jgi:cell division protein FtsB
VSRYRFLGGCKMLRIQIVQAELDRLQQENTALRKRVEALMEGREFK